MTRLFSTSALLLLAASMQAQLSPAITTWLQNTTQTGSYYVAGNSTAQSNGIVVNCQTVQYATNFVYVSTNGVPAYPTGPFQDGNPSQAQSQSAIFKFPLNPVQNTGTPTATTGGNIGVFINGVALFDYRDGVAWNTSTNALCGGPGNPPCPGGPNANMPWMRDAIPAEKPGFDCSKGHPAMGNYHHHQNPSAFDLDLNVISTVCNLYDADGLYTINPNQHSPLIGFAYDGFPIYGAYAYANADGTGGIVRMKSGFQLRNITARTHHADGTDVADGPAINTTYFLGYFREDYEFVPHSGQADYLDIHNGRFCVTPEYPNGTYAYFCTVDANHNSAYPYVVGPTFYGTYANRKVTSIGEPTTVYTASTSIDENALNSLTINVFPSPTADLIAIQMGGIVKEDMEIELLDMTGRVVNATKINKGQTIAYFDTQTLYAGIYLVKIKNGNWSSVKKVVVEKN
ncbi:MAG: YHYH protein [Bacteroidia bacterium]